ncbi:hypothetical protein ACFX5Q_07455 [Mesorhizobium sp. IMUNJ 23033]|uniref:hypothetical protein n=1 Tax=Mesorhizobium sp. IMUNJ 23033 TaxID=3378039 RepID=UPI00384AB362
MNAHMLGDAKEKMTIGDLEPLICDADNMVDVLQDLLENAFGKVPEGNYILTETEGSRLLFVAGLAMQMSMKVKKAYYEAIEGKVS